MKEWSAKGEIVALRIANLELEGQLRVVEGRAPLSNEVGPWNFHLDRPTDVIVTHPSHRCLVRT